MKQKVYFLSFEEYDTYNSTKIYYHKNGPDSLDFYEIPHIYFVIFHAIIEFDDNLLIAIHDFYFVVYDTLAKKILYRRPSLGGANERDAPRIIDSDYYYLIEDIIPIKKDVVLIKEYDSYHSLRNNVCLFNARMNHVIYQFQRSVNHCDIMYRLSNGKVILRFDINFLEIWDFDLIQCDT